MKFKLLFTTLLFFSFQYVAAGEIAFTEEVYSDVQLERVVDRIQKEFESRLETKKYILPWVKSFSLGAGAAIVLLYIIEQCFETESKWKELAMQTAPVFPAVGSTCLGFNLSSKVTEIEAFEVGKRYKLSAEQCFYILLRCPSFVGLFKGQGIYINGFYQSIPAYYEKVDNFIDRYNEYLSQ